MTDLAYYEVQDILKKNPNIKVIHDKESAVKYFTFDTNQWISYDDKDTFKQKVEWANDMGFSGSLIWASDLGTRQDQPCHHSQPVYLANSCAGTDDYEFTAHAALTGKDKLTINSPLSMKMLQDSQMATEDLNSYLRKDCYVQEDSLTRCKSGDDQVGYDKAGRVSQRSKLSLLSW